jgi:Tfp pilus assembly protein PilV
MINTKKTNQKGVTLVEVLVYIGLLSIFMLVLVDIFVTILNAKLETESTSTLNQDARYIYSRMAYDITNASSFTVPNSTTLVVGTNTYTLGGGNLTLNSIKLNGIDTKIDSVNFTRLGNTVKTTFTIESLVKLQSGVQTRTINTTFGLRP